MTVRFGGILVAPVILALAMLLAPSASADTYTDQLGSRFNAQTHVVADPAARPPLQNPDTHVGLNAVLHSIPIRIVDGHCLHSLKLRPAQHLGQIPSRRRRTSLVAHFPDKCGSGYGAPTFCAIRTAIRLRANKQAFTDRHLGSLRLRWADSH